MYCWYDRSTEDIGNNASTCSNETTSGQSSSCSSERMPKVCNKCIELQNPIIMQYYPPAALTRAPTATTTSQAAISKDTRPNKDVNNSKSKTIASTSCVCHVSNDHNTHRTQRKSGDIEDVEETDAEFTEDEAENGTGVVDIASALAAGLPKHVGSVRLSVILIGDSNTGKTSLIARFADDKLIENYETTIGIDFSIAKFRLNGTSVRLQLWDTAGQEKFNAITTQYYHRAMGVVLVYDVTKQSSFDSIAKWNRAVEQHADPEIVKLLCGNKVDLDEERKVSTEQGRKMAQQIGARFCEVSALEATNVFEAFQFFSRDVYREYYAKRNPCASPSAVLLNPGPTSSTSTDDDKTGCCNR